MTVNTQLTEHPAVVGGKPEEQLHVGLQVPGGEEHDVMAPLEGQHVALHGVAGWLDKHHPVTLVLLADVYRFDRAIVEDLYPTKSTQSTKWMTIALTEPL